MLSIIYRCIVPAIPSEKNVVYSVNNINEPDNNGSRASNGITSLQVLIPFVVQDTDSNEVKTRSYLITFN